MTDYKALCARMADELDHYRQLLMDDRRETHALATEARAALAQPEPEGPSKAELRQPSIFDPDQSGFINDEQVMCSGARLPTCCPRRPRPLGQPVSNAYNFTVALEPRSWRRLDR
jgi:hypothetical protein